MKLPFVINWGGVGVGITILGAVQCRAQLTLQNGGFETGALSPWSATGNASIQTALFGAGPYPDGGTYDALIATGTGAVSTTSLETFLLGTSSGQLNAIASPDSVTQGSGLVQTFNMNAGDVLSFQWLFLTNEGSGPGGQTKNDFAFVAVNGTALKLVDQTAATQGSSSTDFAFDTGSFQQYQYKALTTGSYTFGFGVVDVGDTKNSSGLLVDAVTITPVPEPAAWVAMTGLGLLLFAAARSGERVLGKILVRS